MKKTESTMLLLLAILLAGCATDRLIPTTETGHSPLVCSQWLNWGYSSKNDSEQTILNAEHNNRVRDAYCAK